MWIESWGTWALVAFVAAVTLATVAILLTTRRPGSSDAPAARPSTAHRIAVADSATLDAIRRATRGR